MTLAPGQLLAVTGATGAFGGYVVQLAKNAGLTVIADAAEADQEFVSGLGADVVVRRGDDVAARIRTLFPDGVDDLADGSVQGPLVLPAVKDGGVATTVRGYKETGNAHCGFSRSWSATWQTAEAPWTTYANWLRTHSHPSGGPNLPCGRSPSGAPVAGEGRRPWSSGPDFLIVRGLATYSHPCQGGQRSDSSRAMSAANILVAASRRAWRYLRSRVERRDEGFCPWP
jgi:hypothetical protein